MLSCVLHRLFLVALVLGPSSALGLDAESPNSRLEKNQPVAEVHLAESLRNSELLSGNYDARCTIVSGCFLATKWTLKNLYQGIKNAPGYPKAFKAAKGGLKNNKVNNPELLNQLRQAEPGKWTKVYKDGWDGANKVSLHYHQSASGKIFNFKVKPGWSNLP